MRPITLKVSGFMCFRDEQAPLDFSELELFAISGPTGAGKSSVLDAMTYALYGKVPRMGRGSVRELISHGRDRMTVTFEFSVHDRRFLVARSTRRTGTSAVQMDELHGTTSSPLAEGARQVQQAVARVVGLDYDAFTQAVMLPQGDFARFLKGDRAQRRLILQELLRLTVYGRMRELANEQCKDARRSVDMLEQQLQAYA
ncbi:MAG: SMC family ATPase, partial [Acidobacteria bacterium]|nr:SMC family ATPase [Acidobacteriota bacterium]